MFMRKKTFNTKKIFIILCEISFSSHRLDDKELRLQQLIELHNNLILDLIRLMVQLFL